MAFLDEFIDQMRNDLRIRFRCENMAFALERFLEGKIVFNDAIVDHSHLACLMGMGIFVRRPSVGGPSGMTDPHLSIKGLLSDQLLQSC